MDLRYEPSSSKNSTSVLTDANDLGQVKNQRVTISYLARMSHLGTEGESQMGSFLFPLTIKSENDSRGDGNMLLRSFQFPIAKKVACESIPSHILNKTLL